MWTFSVHIFLFSEVIIIKELQINEQIRDKEVRLIGADGSQLGIFSAYNAQKIADEAHLDLVKISPNAVPPVCKVMDYGKYRYEQSKKEKEAKKNQKIVELKEIRLSMTIDDGDLNTKAKTAAKFLKEGNKVIVVDNFCDFYNPKIKEDNVKHNLNNANYTLKRIDIRNR